tara:strand:+ start:2728 stop:3021 length:294 start_codon:yes stop_codon:yes gene_type:complete
MIVQTVNQSAFTEAFRAIRPDNFSYEGLKALYEYFDQYSEETGQPFELDVIAICVEFSEYAHQVEIFEIYPDLESLDDLRDNTTVIEFDGGIIIQDY